MQQNLVFAVVGSVCVAFFSYFQALGDVVFVQRPQNLTIFNLKEPFFFNCSTDAASTDGMDWRVRIGESLERICSSTKFYLTGDNSCLLNYSMEVPNNRTLNLIVDPRIASLGDKYCCQSENGAGKQSCSYLTISPEVSTDHAFTDSTTTVFSHKNTTASEEPLANGINHTTLAIIIPVILVVVIIAAIAGILIWRNRTKPKSPRREYSSVRDNPPPGDSGNNPG